MSDKSTLVAYVTKGKATEEAAELIGQVLRNDFGLSVDIVDLKASSPDIDDYSNVIIGSGVRMGRVYKKALKFMENDFSGNNIAVFLSSLEGGDEKSHGEAIEKYVEKEVKTRLNVEPVAAETFGGRIKIFGFSVQDNIDREKIRDWAKEVGEKFVCSIDD
jgi:menaquinone-dependent protoporphyrinogen IX oxidase